MVKQMRQRRDFITQLVGACQNFRNSNKTYVEFYDIQAKIQT